MLRKASGWNQCQRGDKHDARFRKSQRGLHLDFSSVRCMWAVHFAQNAKSVPGGPVCRKFGSILLRVCHCQVRRVSTDCKGMNMTGKLKSELDQRATRARYKDAR